MNPVKSLIVLGVSGTLATGAYLTSGYWLPRKNARSILQVLSDNKYTLLDTSETEGWDVVLSKYKAANPNGAQDVSQLQKECKNLISKELNDTDYKKARRWCVKGQSVSERLVLFGRTSLSTSGATNDNDWKIKISDHKLPASVNKLDSDFSGDESANLAAIKSSCTSLSTKTNTDESFEDDFFKSFDWCSIPKG